MTPAASSALGDPAKKPWIVIVGPTGVGKTPVAERLAEHLHTEILVADSRQVYRGMDIATGKPDAAARRRVKRHLIDLLAPDQLFSAGAYQKTAETLIKKMEAAGDQILIEGGSGLYVKALLYGLWEGPPADWSYRKGLAKQEKEGGEGTLHRLLAAIDPEAAKAIHYRDRPKLVRALEVAHLSGRTITQAHKNDRQRGSGREHWVFGLRRQRTALYGRIEARIERMLSEGLVDETMRLLSSGLSSTLPSMRGLGYRQIIPALLGACTMDEAVATLKRDTRRYAKRQMTWFKADPHIRWLDLEETEPPGQTMKRILSQIQGLAVLE